MCVEYIPAPACPSRITLRIIFFPLERFRLDGAAATGAAAAGVAAPAADAELAEPTG